MRAKQILSLLIIVLIIISLTFFAGCFRTSNEDVEELKGKVDQLEEELAKYKEGETTNETSQDTESTSAIEETSEEEEAEVSGEEINKDKICLIDYSLSDFTKFQTLGYEYNLNLIKEFESAAYNAISLAILLKPDDARLTKLYDYVNKGGKAICYYYEYSTGYNDTFEQLFGVSIVAENVLREHTNSITLDGELFSNFTGGLKISYIKSSSSYMRIPTYINDIDKKSIWHSEFVSSKTSKKNYFALIKNIGAGQVLFIPHVSEMIPFDDKHYDDMDNAVFAKKIVEWSLE